MPTEEELAAAKAQEEAKAKEEAAKTQEKKFTQAELDAHIKERLERAEKKAKEEREAEKLKAEQEAAAKNGEWQKVAEAREKENAQIKADADKARAELEGERLKAAAITEAGKPVYGDKKKKFINPEAAYKLVKADKPDITSEGLAEAFKALAKDNPWMLEQAQTIPGGPIRQQQQQQNQPDLSKLPRANY